MKYIDNVLILNKTEQNKKEFESFDPMNPKYKGRYTLEFLPLHFIARELLDS